MNILSLPINKSIPVLVIETTAPPTSTTDTATNSTAAITTTNVHNFFNVTTNKPEPFINQDPKEWIEQYDIISSANGWNDDKKLANIPALFQKSKNAQYWYAVTFQNKAPKNYMDFCDKFINTLSPRNNDFVAYSKMNERRQQIAEQPIDNFFAKMHMINQYDPNFKEQMKVNLLVDGLLPEFKSKIFGQCDTTKDVLEELRKLQK